MMDALLVAIVFSPIWGLGLFAAISASRTYRKDVELRSRDKDSPYACDGCDHHESFHDMDGCKYGGSYHHCGCVRFVSAHPERYKAMKELESFGDK